MKVKAYKVQCCGRSKTTTLEIKKEKVRHLGSKRLIILVRNNVDLLFKTESGKIRIISNKVYLAIPKPATITCRDKKKLRS